MRIYFAAPLFNDMERGFNSRMTEQLELFSTVFLPQRDGLLMRDLVRDGMSLESARRLVYEADVNALRQCDCVVAILDGRTVDEGVAFEIGFARALGKSCVGLKTDDRVLLSSGDNPMILAGCDIVLGSLLEVMTYLKSGLGRVELSA
jgi:nucleoside 2-deoxyribosyltransferase